MKQKRVLLFLSVLVLASLTCTLPATIARFVEKGLAFVDPPYTVVPDPKDAPVIVDPNLTIEQLLAKVEEDLIEEQRNCNSAKEKLYYPCLYTAMQNGADANEALQQCSQYAQALEINDRGSLITISDQHYYSRDNDNYFGIEYFSEGGVVEGVVAVSYDEGDPGSCTVQVNYTFNGMYYPKFCSLSGSGTYKQEHIGDYCIGGINQEYETTWNAVIEDGYLRGVVFNTAIHFSYEVRGH